MKWLGEKGEEKAVKYLVKKGYQIIDQNASSFLGEIDIIAKKDNQLVFVEVKTKHNADYGTPEEMITPQKQKKLIQLARSYLQNKPPQHDSWQIDVIGIIRQKGKWQINHLKNAVNEQ